MTTETGLGHDKENGNKYVDISSATYDYFTLIKKETIKVYIFLNHV